MRVKEFLIRNYGPVLDSGRISLHNFNLFWGENEDGKTLTQEAIIRFLLGKNRKLFPNIERVKETPSGYLIITKQNGEEYKLPDPDVRDNILCMSAEECRNLLIIQNSDLTIARENEFYGGITERLTGVRTSQIKKLKKHLRVLGNLTERLDTVNNRGSKYLKKRLEEAKLLLEECQDFRQMIVNKGMENLEENLVELQHKARCLELEIETLEKVRCRQKKELAQYHLKTIYDLIEKINALRGFNRKQAEDWQSYDTIIKTEKAKETYFTQQHERYQLELVLEEKRLKDLKAHLPISEQQKHEIDEQLKPLLNGFDHIHQKVIDANNKKPFFLTGLFLALTFSLTSLVGMYWKPELYLFIGGGLNAGIAVMLVFFYFSRFVKPRKELKNIEEQIQHQANELGIPCYNFSQIENQMQRFEENVSDQSKRISAKQEQIDSLKNTCENLQENQLAEVEKNLKKAHQKVQELQSLHRIDTLEQYQYKLQERKNSEQKLKESANTLKNILGANGETLADFITYWEHELKMFKIDDNLPQNIHFDEKKLSDTRTSQKQIKETIEQLQHQMREFRQQLVDIERQANEVILPEDGSYICHSLLDLAKIEAALQEFLTNTAEEQRIVRTALEIFGDIEENENQKISTLFGEQSNISKLYNDITSGLYPAVYYQAGGQGIQVKRHDGTILTPNRLSGGAFDQLYFVIRLSLAENLLHEEKGFFILDDPFLKSDRERLRLQLEMLLQISQRGWQIIYFSAKEEVKDALKEYIANRQVRLQPMPQVTYKAGETFLESYPDVV